MIYLACKNCQQRISTFLDASPQQWSRMELSNFTDKDLVQEGSYIRDNRGDYILNVLDKRKLAYHPDLRRFNGCCGPPAEGEPNLICVCKNEIGREATNCSDPHFIKIDKKNVFERRDDWPLFSILQQVENRQLFTGEEINNLLDLFSYGQEKEAVIWLSERLEAGNAQELLKQLAASPVMYYWGT